MAVVTDPAPGLDDDEVEPQWESRDWLTVRQGPAIEQAVGGRPHTRALAVVDGFFRQPELATRPPADLDHDERLRRTRVDRHEVKLVATDMDVPGQDEPASLRETIRDRRLGGITRLLRRRPSRSPGLIRHEGDRRRRRLSAAYRG